MKKDYIIATKKISTLGSITGQSNTFSKDEIKELEAQPFTRSVGAFTPTLFKVSAGLGMEQTGIRISTDMFFESVPDEFVDVSLDKWHFDEGTQTIPIIIPRNYLNLYNFGFAQSRSLPKLSEGLMSLIQMDIMMRGNGRVEQYKGNIVGFSNRLNTILVPQSFMKWANENFAPGAEAQPSRLIIEVNNPADSSIAGYFQKKGYETEDGKENTYDFSLSFDVEKYDDANAEELQGIFGSSIIVQFTDAIVGIFENSDAVAEGFAYARYYHQTGIDSEWETNPLVKLGEKLMQEHAMLDFHKIVLDTASRERLLKR